MLRHLLTRVLRVSPASNLVRRPPRPCQISRKLEMDVLEGRVIIVGVVSSDLISRRDLSYNGLRASSTGLRARPFIL